MDNRRLKPPKRSLRRHHAERLLKRAWKRQEDTEMMMDHSWYGRYNKPSRKADEKWRKRLVLLNARVGAACSCYMCRNRREELGPTLQERRSQLELEEYENL